MSYAASKLAEAEARGDTRTADYWRHIKETVDAAPPLSAHTRAKLRVLLSFSKGGRT